MSGSIGIAVSEYCPDCESALVEKVLEREFQYGQPGHPLYTMLRVTHPVFVCEDCGCHVSDYRGEDATAAAVQEHLKSKGIICPNP